MTLLPQNVTLTPPSAADLPARFLDHPPNQAPHFQATVKNSQDLQSNTQDLTTAASGAQAQAKNEAQAALLELTAQENAADQLARNYQIGILEQTKLPQGGTALDAHQNLALDVLYHPEKFDFLA